MMAWVADCGTFAQESWRQSTEVCTRNGRNTQFGIGGDSSVKNQYNPIIAAMKLSAA